MTAEQVNDVLGCGLERGMLLLEAAGGDVGLAVELGRGMLGGGGSDDRRAVGGNCGHQLAGRTGQTGGKARSRKEV